MPPSSSSTGFKYAAAFIAICRPTPVDPVKLHFRIEGCEIKASKQVAASSGLCTRKLTTPGGKPASWKRLATKWCVRGLSSDPYSVSQCYTDVSHLVVVADLQDGRVAHRYSCSYGSKSQYKRRIPWSDSKNNSQGLFHHNSMSIRIVHYWSTSSKDSTGCQSSHLIKQSDRVPNVYLSPQFATS